jgi:hypothetical protein
MTRDEYEKRKLRLEEQRREGIELLDAAYRQQLRALELVWMTTAEEDLPSPQPAPAPDPPPAPPAAEPEPPAAPGRRPSWALLDDVEDALPGLPDHFDRNDLCRAIGYEPERSSLFRTLQGLIADGVIAIHQRGSGKTPTVYRKTAVQHNAHQG